MSTEPAEGPTDAQESEPEARREQGADASEPDVPEGSEGPGEAVAEPAGSGAMSEAEAELAAQRELRQRIARRRAERQQPVDSGGKLSGTAADLLAAVRAVESGERPVQVFDTPEPATRRPAPRERSAPVPPVRGAEPSAAAVEAVREALAAGGAPDGLAGPAAAALGEDAAQLLRQDPWQLLRVAAVRPEQADAFARALLGPACGPDDERRGRALAVWLLDQAAAAGHTALDASVLSGTLGRYSVPDPDAAVHSAVAEGDLLVFQDSLDTPEAPAPSGDGPPASAGPHPDAPVDPPDGAAGGAVDPQGPVRVLVGLERYALAEESLADALAGVVNAPPAAVPDPAAWAAAAPTARGSTADLLHAVAAHSLVLHTGGEASRAEPAALLAAAHSLGLRVCAAAHTADGRRRFAALARQAATEIAGTAGTAGAAEATGSAQTTGAAEAAGGAAPGPAALPEDACVTVSGLLASEEGPGRDAGGGPAVDLLVVLDAPQLDAETAALLVESLPDGARLVLSGDPAVLWSAGPGRVFADLLAAGCCPHVASRVPDPGPIGELVSGIGAGELQQVEAPGKEVVVVPVRDAAEAVHRTVQLVADSVPRTFDVPADGTQVITPGHGGAAGTQVLNAALKERLNPGPGRFGGFDVGDRIAYAAATGRTLFGHVVRADAEGLHLDCEGTPVVVPKDRVARSVRHGWALTAQQAVGVRRAAAVVVLPGDATKALTRSWVYTAFGRGERHLSVVQGADRALPRAVAEVPAKPRTTRLATLLRAQLTAGGGTDDHRPAP